MAKRSTRKRRGQKVVPCGPSRREIFETARLATVAFGVRCEGTLKILGSGVIVDARGVVVTARHVVDEVVKAADKLKETVPDAAPQLVIVGQTKIEDSKIKFIAHAVTVRRAEVGRSGTMDMALLLIRDAPIDLTALPIDSSLDLREGDVIATCGFPYGYEVHLGKSVISSFLTGTISAVAPHPMLPLDRRRHYLLQLPVNPGNSGGAVFDPHTGAVIGIISGGLEDENIPTGLCIAEPVHPLQEDIRDLLKLKE